MSARLLAAALALAIALPVHAQTVTHSANRGWKFTRDAVDPANPQAATWRTVDLPHDWAIEGPVDPAGNGDTGKLPWQGEGWYLATLTVGPDAPVSPDFGGAKRRVYLDFDGVMAFPTIYVNGVKAGEWDYGYTPFRVDITDQVRWGVDARNTVLVHVDTRKWYSRWYPGAGIYRGVSVTVAEPVHLAQWGVRVTTNGDETEGTPANTAWVETTIENHTREALIVFLETRLYAPDGTLVETLPRGVRLPAGNPATVRQEFRVDDPLLWDIEHPHRYRVETRVSGNDGVLDEETTRFGFRTFSFSADGGFRLNGRRVQLKGVNLHHDQGVLGGAFNRRAAERQLEIMLDMGVNMVRTSHNPPARELIELCDEMGILVWDEAFDKWDRTAGRPDLQPPLVEFGHRNIRAMVMRDRNSPSVVLWSIGNELGGEEREEGIEPARMAMMAGFVRAYDDTRPVTMANHVPGLVDGKNFVALDVDGWNYGRRYWRKHESWPNEPLIYSESASALSTRGYYEPELPNRQHDYPSSLQISSYDLTSASWSDIADREFAYMAADTFVAGEIVWTGFDYLGEPTPHNREARSSYFGIVDLCGFPKDRYYLYRSHWRPDETTVHILPHWNWPDRRGKNVPVFVYTNGDSAELFLNGKSLGMRRKGEVPAKAPNLAEGRSPLPWRAVEGQNAAFQVDLGASQRVRYLSLDTPREEKLYAYTIEASRDGRTWRAVASKPTSMTPQWGGPRRVYHDVDVTARFLRVVFGDSREGAVPGLDGFGAYERRVENEYYDVTYDYRLRWNEVTYQPGTLRAVAYRDGQAIGEATVSTTGEATALRLLADRAEVTSDREDLVYVTTEALDAKGLANPLSDHLVRYTIEGPGEIAGVCNGDPLSMEPDQAAERRLFYGKALLIVRPVGPGVIRVTAEAAGLSPAAVSIIAR